MKTRTTLATTLAVAIAALLAACAQQGAMNGMSADQPPFGGADSVSYAGTLWAALEAEHLAGPDAIRPRPYKGTEPHGAVLENMEARLTVGGHTGPAFVKRNYVGPGITVDQVANSGREHLDSVTVMYRRERGYDPDNQDWFWAKYNPDGTLQSNPKGMKLAGRVAKGAPQGCIACHRGAPGGDYVYTHDRYAR